MAIYGYDGFTNFDGAYSTNANGRLAATEFWSKRNFTGGGGGR